MRAIFLDSGPLGLAAHPKAPAAKTCQRWLRQRAWSGDQLVVPEICDYEVRRELLRMQAMKAVEALDALCRHMIYAPITSEAMREAASLWALMRQKGQPTADPKALDGDVILAAQARLYAKATGHEVVIATTNVGHLQRMVVSSRWEEIK